MKLKQSLVASIEHICQSKIEAGPYRQKSEIIYHSLESKDYFFGIKILESKHIKISLYQKESKNRFATIQYFPIISFESKKTAS
jgi:hypothetical protein